MSTVVRAGDELEAQRRALALIVDFGNQLCSTIPLEGTGGSLQLSGDAKTQLNGIIKELADLGVEGAIKYKRSEFQGLLQKDLAEALNRSTNCKLEVFRSLKDRLLPNTATSSTANGAGRATPMLGGSSAARSLQRGDVLVVHLDTGRGEREPYAFRLQVNGDHFWGEMGDEGNMIQTEGSLTAGVLRFSTVRVKHNIKAATTQVNCKGEGKGNGPFRGKCWKGSRFAEFEAEIGPR